MASLTTFTADIEIAAPRATVWAALTQASGPRPWLNDAEVASSWEPGAEIAIDVVLEGRHRHDRGTVEVAEAPSLLRYSLWSSVSRRPDQPEHRSVVTFRLAPTPSGGTLLTLVHDNLTAKAATTHVAFFWPVALAVLRDGLEGRDGGPVELRGLACSAGGAVLVG